MKLQSFDACGLKKAKDLQNIFLNLEKRNYSRKVISELENDEKGGGDNKGGRTGFVKSRKLLRIEVLTSLKYTKVYRELSNIAKDSEALQLDVDQLLSWADLNGNYVLIPISVKSYVLHTNVTSPSLHIH